MTVLRMSDELKFVKAVAFDIAKLILNFYLFIIFLILVIKIFREYLIFCLFDS